jgi:hypothetical protein
MGPLVIQIISYLLWFPLKILGISALMRVGVRRYPLILTYMIVTLLFAVVQAPLSISYMRSHRKQGEWFQMLHSVGEGFTYTLILAVVISLIYRATAQSRPRRLIRFSLIAGGLLFMSISFLIHYDSHVILGVWVTPWTRDLHFCAAILDLALWGLLLASREKDSTVLLLTGGMGIMFAGEAIGASIRSVAIHNASYPLFLFGHSLMLLADSVSLYIWWQTFKKQAAAEAALAKRASSAVFR